MWNNATESRLNGGKLSGGFVLKTDRCVPMSKEKLHLKLMFQKEQVQNEGRFISGLNMYLGTREGVPCVIFLFNVQKECRSFSKTTFIFLPVASE
jgi:hypothetical protein